GPRDRLVLGHARFGPEAAADRDLMADDLLWRQAKNGGNFLTYQAWRLGGQPQVQLAGVVVPLSHDAVRLHRRVRLPAEPAHPGTADRRFWLSRFQIAPATLKHL